MNNNICIALIISSLAGLSTVIGGLVVFAKFKDRDGFITFALSFSLSVMISISVFDLIPESVKIISDVYGVPWTIILGISIFVCGKLLVNVVNSKVEKYKESNNLYRVGILSMIALMIHNFPEGCVRYVSHKNIRKNGI